MKKRYEEAQKLLLALQAENRKLNEKASRLTLTPDEVEMKFEPVKTVQITKESIGDMHPYVSFPSPQRIVDDHSDDASAVAFCHIDDIQPRVRSFLMRDLDSPILNGTEINSVEDTMDTSTIDGNQGVDEDGDDYDIQHDEYEFSPTVIKEENELIIEDTIQIANDLFCCNICDGSFDSCDALDRHFNDHDSLSNEFSSAKTADEDNIDDSALGPHETLNNTNAAQNVQVTNEQETISDNTANVHPGQNQPVPIENHHAAQIHRRHSSNIYSNHISTRDRSRSSQRNNEQKSNYPTKGDIPNSRDRHSRYEKRRSPSPARKFIDFLFLYIYLWY